MVQLAHDANVSSKLSALQQDINQTLLHNRRTLQANGKHAQTIIASFAYSFQAIVLASLLVLEA